MGSGFRIVATGSTQTRAITSPDSSGHLVLVVAKSWSSEATANGLTGPRHMDFYPGGNRTMSAGPTDARATVSGLTGPNRGSCSWS